jgi:hypothetical protein
MRGLTVALLFASCLSLFAQTPQPTPDVAKYGEYPTDYMTVIKDWLSDQLIDPASAVIEFTSTPKPSDMPTGDGQHVYGYLVEFKVNSRNRFGGYTGYQKHGALIRNGEVLRGTGFGY